MIVAFALGCTGRFLDDSVGSMESDGYAFTRVVMMLYSPSGALLALMLAIIGGRWLKMKDDQRRLVDAPAEQPDSPPPYECALDLFILGLFTIGAAISGCFSAESPLNKELPPWNEERTHDGGHVGMDGTSTCEPFIGSFIGMVVGMSCMCGAVYAVYIACYFVIIHAF